MESPKKPDSKIPRQQQKIQNRECRVAYLLVKGSKQHGDDYPR